MSNYKPSYWRSFFHSKKIPYKNLEDRLKSFQNTKYDPIAAKYGYIVTEKGLECFCCLNRLEPYETYYHKPCCNFQDFSEIESRNLRYIPTSSLDASNLVRKAITSGRGFPTSSPIPTPLGEKYLCVVCLVKDVCICTIPCHHIVLCDECFQKDISKCPVCRTDILDTLNVFF